MIAFFAIWLDREGILTWNQVVRSGEESAQAVGKAIEHFDFQELRKLRIPRPVDFSRLWNAWDEPLIHRDWSRALSGINLGVAGLILVLSAFFERFAVGLFAIFGAAVVLVGPVMARAELGDSLGRNTTAMWLVAGVIVAVLGHFVRPSRRDP
jgi:hypothetical protein